MKLSRQAKRMFNVILIVSFLAAIISILYYRSKEVIPFLLGLLLGTFTSIVRLILLEMTVNKFIYEKKKQSLLQLSHLGRLFISFIAMLIGATVEGISLLGVVIGIFSYQLATYTLRTTLIENKKSSEEINEEE